MAGVDVEPVEVAVEQQLCVAALGIDHALQRIERRTVAVKPAGHIKGVGVQVVFGARQRCSAVAVAQRATAAGFGEAVFALFGAHRTRPAISDGSR
jgi:hypothetical protein